MTVQRHAVIPGVTPIGDGTYQFNSPLSMDEIAIIGPILLLVKKLSTESIGAAVMLRLDEMERKMDALLVRERQTTSSNKRTVDSGTLALIIKAAIADYMKKVSLSYSNAYHRALVYTAIYNDFLADHGFIVTNEMLLESEIKIDAYIRLGYGEKLREHVVNYNGVINVSEKPAPRRKKPGRPRKAKASKK
ncbi:hypothetical protein [Paenibacillus sp. YIM B09110]|uniref:hypothetical protein n=1 Tax=Paenibacillus sp. YIM B09110 TaxID=3126102 RepID=UPI00301CF704